MLSFCHQPSKEGTAAGAACFQHACTDAQCKCGVASCTALEPNEYRISECQIMRTAGCASSRATSRRWMSSRRCRCCARTTTSPTFMCPPRRCAADTLLRRLLRMRSRRQHVAWNQHEVVQQHMPSIHLPFACCARFDSALLAMLMLTSRLHRSSARRA